MTVYRYDSDGDLLPQLATASEVSRYCTAKLERAGFKGFSTRIVDLPQDGRAVVLIVGTPKPHPELPNGRRIIIGGAIVLVDQIMARVVPFAPCSISFFDPETNAVAT